LPESVLPPADVFASLDPSQPDGRAPPSYVAEGGHGHRRQYRFRQIYISDMKNVRRYFDIRTFT
ncbi:MAG: hypothetical protein J6U28_03350, partial [Bacteroidales bacterium]|nr:hypothetical protein [Bacteroidales bacterium]